MTEQYKGSPSIPTGLLADVFLHLQGAGIIVIKESDLNSEGIRRLLRENGLDDFSSEIAANLDIIIEEDENTLWTHRRMNRPNARMKEARRLKF